MNRLEELLADFADGLLTESERQELELLVASDEDAALALGHSIRIESALRRTRLTISVVDEVLKTVRADQQRRLKEGVLERVRSLPATPHRSASRLLDRLWQFSRAWRTTLAAATVVLLVTLVLFWRDQDMGPGDLQVVQAVDLQFYRHFRWRTAAVGDTLSSHCRLRTSRIGNARLQFLTEASSVDLGPLTRACLNKANSSKGWTVDQGRIEVQAAHQTAGHPLRIATRQGVAEVVGTTFSLSARTSTSWLRVDEGSVRLTRSSDSQSVLVAAGNFAAVGGDSSPVTAMQIKDILRLPISLDLRRATSDGDGFWSAEGNQIRQSKVSTVPMTNAIWGTPESPGSAFIIPAQATESFEITCDVQLEKSIHEVRSNWIWPKTFGVRFYLGRYDLQMNVENGVAAGLGQISFGCGSPRKSDPPVKFDGTITHPLSALGSGPVHFRCQLWRSADGHCRALGRVWSGAREPVEWMISGGFTLNEPLNQVGMQTISCAARFESYCLSLVETNTIP